MTGAPVPPTLLLTRPQAQSQPLAAALEAEGWRTIVWPLLEIVDVGPPPDLSGAQAVLLSSANAARRLGLCDIPALCVGPATAEAASRTGARNVLSADGDADALARLAARTLLPEKGPVLFARGAEVAGNLAGALMAAGFEVREQVVYAARPARAAPFATAHALAAGEVAAVVFYSPRSAQVFAGLAEGFRAGLARTAAVAISAAAAVPLEGLGFGAVSVAARPDGAAMLDAIRALREGGGAAS
ncbi:MAG: uroporphyrinogen-III synthase [Rubrimonas sp.]|uniref:uroporphyrinogen-III synthase n=1 Tax=Rubrimonas sp. TaxID=2036015 RepID=UPI002FDD36F4